MSKYNDKYMPVLALIIMWIVLIKKLMIKELNIKHNKFLITLKILEI